MHNDARHRAGRHRAPREAQARVGRHRAARRSGSRTAGSLAAAAAVITVAVVALAWPSPESRAETDTASTTQSQPPVTMTAPSSRFDAPDRALASRSNTRPQPKSSPQPESEEPAWLAACAAISTTATGNGLVPDEQLCELPDTGGHHLKPAAARAWWTLDQRFRQRFGVAMCITDSYRSIEQQYALRAAKPGLAAAPGTSNHGWATALDLCGGVESYDSDEYQWLLDNASRFGWTNPAWAQRYGSKPEPWHWEFNSR